MSLRAVLTTVMAALQDPATGLAARATAIAAAEGIAGGVISTNFNFERWSLSGQMNPAGMPNVALGLQRGATTLMLPNELHRDGDWALALSYETFAADAPVIEDNITVVAMAAAEVLDRLREYSDAHAGTVMQVREPIGYEFGSFSTVTSDNGFTLNFVVQERSTT
jgi:hypothetical protein